MGVSADPCCAECQNLALNTNQQSDLVITSDCPCAGDKPTEEMGGTITSPAKGSGYHWTWEVPTDDPNAPNCAVRSEQSGDVWANTSIVLDCIEDEQSEHCGEWRLTYAQYISDGGDPGEFCAPSGSEKYLTTEISVNKDGYLEGKATMYLSCLGFSCILELEWKPPQ